MVPPRFSQQVLQLADEVMDILCGGVRFEAASHHALEYRQSICFPAAVGPERQLEQQAASVRRSDAHPQI